MRRITKPAYFELNASFPMNQKTKQRHRIYIINNEYEKCNPKTNTKPVYFFGF